MNNLHVEHLFRLAQWIANEVDIRLPLVNRSNDCAWDFQRAKSRDAQLLCKVVNHTMDPDSRSRRGRDERRDDRRDRSPEKKESESGGGLREMGVDEMNALRAKLGLKPLRIDEPPKPKEQPAQQPKPTTTAKPEPVKTEGADVEEKIAMYVSFFHFVISFHFILSFIADLIL
jgi:hypothetical protein